MAYFFLTILYKRIYPALTEITCSTNTNSF